MIYLLEDDRGIRELVEYAAVQAGMQLKGFERPSEFWAALDKELPEMILLDIMLPEEDGLEILRKLRARSDTRRLPVMMLTAKDTEYDKVVALDAGADDYMAKPFALWSCSAAIRALLRRSALGTVLPEYHLGTLFVSPSRHEVKVDGKAVSLTYKEFELLTLLLEHQGAVLTRDQILRRIWGIEFNGESRTVDVHIRTLRLKLGGAGSLIKTVAGWATRSATDSEEPSLSQLHSHRAADHALLLHRFFCCYCTSIPTTFPSLICSLTCCPG